MNVAFACPLCGKHYDLPEGLIGKKARCSACGQVNRIPAAVPIHELATDARPVFSPAIGAEPKSRAPRAQSFLARLREPSVIQGVSVCFVALSVADILITYALLRRGPSFYEANPVAQWFFQRWNIAGMAALKFSVIGAVIAMSEVIERKKPGWGRGVILLGCAASAAVVWHGARLLRNA